MYARVSSEEQIEGYSIDAQRRALQPSVRLRDGRHLSSLRKENPPEQRTSTSALSSSRQWPRGLHNECDITGSFHKIDRFSRKLRITLEYFDKLGKAGVGFFSIVEQMDFSTPWGKFHSEYVGWTGRALYSDNLSLETKKGWHERRAQGLYCGTLPFGAMKGEDGIPIPDMQDRKAAAGRARRWCFHNYEGLKMAFDLAAQGELG